MPVNVPLITPAENVKEIAMTMTNVKAIRCVLVETVPSQFLDALEKVAIGIKVQKTFAFSLN